MTSNPFFSSTSSSTQSTSDEYPSRGGRLKSGCRVQTRGPADRTVGTKLSPQRGVPLSSASSSVSSSPASSTERSSSRSKLMTMMRIDGTNSTGTRTGKNRSRPSLLSRMEQAGMLAHDSLQLSTEELLVNNKAATAKSPTEASEPLMVSGQCSMSKRDGHGAVPISLRDVHNQWKCPDWKGRSCGVTTRAWNHELENVQKGGDDTITSKRPQSVDCSSVLTALVGGRQVRVSIAMDQSSHETTDQTAEAAAPVFDGTNLDVVPLKGTKRKRTEKPRRSSMSPSPERVLSRSSRRTRRSGGEVGWMSLQISYRGVDWDPLNSSWVPKQKKTSRPKTIGRRDVTKNEPTAEMNMSDANPVPTTGRSNHDTVHQETNFVSGPSVQDDAINDNFENSDAKDSASVSNEIVGVTKAEPALQDEESLPKSIRPGHGIPTPDMADQVSDEYSCGVVDTKARQDTFPQLIANAPTLPQGHIHPLMSPEDGPVPLSAQLAGCGVSELPITSSTAIASNGREGFSGAAHLTEQTQCPPRDQFYDGFKNISAVEECHGRGNPNATIEKRIDATFLGSHKVQEHGSNRESEIKHHFHDSGKVTSSFEQVGDSEPILNEGINTLLKAVHDMSAMDIEGSSAEENAEISKPLSTGNVPPSFAVNGYRVSASDPPFLDHGTLQQAGPSTHSRHGEGLRDSFALNPLHQPAVRDTSSQDSVEVDNESNPFVLLGDRSQVDFSSEEGPEMADTNVVVFLGEEEEEDIKVAVLMEGVDGPAAQSVNKKDYEVLATNTKMDANYVSAPSVTRQEHWAFLENHPLGALFEAVEMVHEVPVSDAEEETLGSAANGEDIFADAPDDDVIEIAEPLIGEEIARRFPRSALNLDVYGPTPPHMGEIWYKMYGSRW